MPRESYCNSASICASDLKPNAVGFCSRKHKYPQLNPDYKASEVESSETSDFDYAAQAVPTNLLDVPIEYKVLMLAIDQNDCVTLRARIKPGQRLVSFIIGTSTWNTQAYSERL